MRILHVILGKADKRRANGVNQVIAGLSKYTARNGVQVDVIGLAQSANIEGEVISRDGFSVRVFSKKGSFFRHAVQRAIENSDVVHLHGTYSPLNIWVGWLCDKLKKPYVVTLHGGLSPERNTWRNSVQKSIFHIVLQKRHLERASFVHVLTEEESTEAFAMVYPRAIYVIPNGVDLDDFPRPILRSKIAGEITIGYLGRISREKNLEALCSAFARVSKDIPARLLLAGPLSSEANALARRYAGSGVMLIGPQFGLSKRDFFSKIDLFVHPSKTDVFSIGAMEALASGLPLIITRTSDASHFAHSRAFIMCEPTPFGIERALRAAFEHRIDLLLMAKRGRMLVEERFNWDSAAVELVTAYRNILGL